VKEVSDVGFSELLEINCFATDATERRLAAEQLERDYGCEIQCPDIDRSVLFAHHAKGCTIVAAKLSKGVVIYQNVTLGSNMKYNKIDEQWENVGSPIIAENVIIADGAKVLGPVIIGKNSVVGAGAIITKDIPPDSVAYGVNHYKPRNPDYDLIYRKDMISGEEISRIDRERVEEYESYAQKEKTTD
jgi:serine O-acetyltransferase